VMTITYYPMRVTEGHAPSLVEAVLIGLILAAFSKLSSANFEGHYPEGNPGVPSSAIALMAMFLSVSLFGFIGIHELHELDASQKLRAAFQICGAFVVLFGSGCALIHNIQVERHRRWEASHKSRTDELQQANDLFIQATKSLASGDWLNHVAAFNLLDSINRSHPARFRKVILSITYNYVTGKHLQASDGRAICQSSALAVFGVVRNSEIQSHKLANIDLSEIVMEGSDMESQDFKRIEFEQIKLSNSIFKNIDFAHSQFIDCDLSSVRFEKCNLKDVQFANCDLTNVDVISSCLKNANVRDDCRYQNIEFPCSKNMSHCPKSTDAKVYCRERNCNSGSS